jgi:hypothetical protein
MNSGYKSLDLSITVTRYAGTGIRKASQVSDPSRVKGWEATWACQVHPDAHMNLGDGSNSASVESMRLMGNMAIERFCECNVRY